MDLTQNVVVSRYQLSCSCLSFLCLPAPIGGAAEISVPQWPGHLLLATSRDCPAVNREPTPCADSASLWSHTGSTKLCLVWPSLAYFGLCLLPEGEMVRSPIRWYFVSKGCSQGIGFSPQISLLHSKTFASSPPSIHTVLPFPCRGWRCGLVG